MKKVSKIIALAFLAMDMLPISVLAQDVDPTPAISEIRDYQNGSGKVTVIGILNAYGTSYEPKWMEATIRAQDNSWSQTVCNPANKNGKIIKGNTYALPTVTVPKSGNYVVNVGVGDCFGWKTVYGQSRTIYVNFSKQTLSTPQWINKLPSSVSANQDYTISWTQVPNAQKYKVYFTQGGKEVGWNYEPTGNSQLVKIPNVTGTVYVGVIAMPSNYNNFNQSNELQMSFRVNLTSEPAPPLPLPPSPTINSFKTNKTGYITNENVTFSWNASNYNSWRIVWLKNGKEADYATEIQNNKIASYKDVVTSTVYNGAILYIYSGINGSGSFSRETVNFNVKSSSLDGIEILSYNDYLSAFTSPPSNKFVYWCARAARDAYDAYGGPSYNEAMNSLGFQYETPYIPDLKVFIGNKTLEREINGITSVVMISIRGTTSGTTNWQSNLKADPVDWEHGLQTNNGARIGTIVGNTAGAWWGVIGGMLGGYSFSAMDLIGEFLDDIPEVHRGFYECTNLVWKTIQPRANTLYIVTGHSLGGAIAELLSLKLRDTTDILAENIICIGFASPKVGDKDLWKYADNRGITSRIYKILNTVDLVPFAGIFAYSLANRHFEITESRGSMTANHDMSSVYLEYVKAQTLLNPMAPFKSAAITPANPTRDIGYVPYNPNSSVQQIGTSSNAPTTVNQQQLQTYNTTHFIRTGSATLLNYAGRNYIGDINATNGFRLTMNSNSFKTANISILYKSDNRGGKLIVNGVTQNINFPSTNWNWGTKEVQIQLRPGSNTIEFYGGYQTTNAPDIAEITIK